MKKLIAISTMAVFTAFAAGAQSRAQSAAHSNSPASADREKGAARAADAGRGKKRGLKKIKHHTHARSRKRTQK